MAHSRSHKFFVFEGLILHPLMLIQEFIFDVIWEEQIPRHLFSGISKQLFCIESKLKCNIPTFARSVNLSITNQVNSISVSNISNETCDSQTSCSITDLLKTSEQDYSKYYFKLLFSGGSTKWSRFKV